jgi:Bacterial inner membrane protein
MLMDVIMDHAASICAWFAMAGLAAWPLFRTRNTMLAVQLGALIVLSLHYALLGITTAATVNTLGAVQIGASLLIGTKPRLRWIGYALAATMVASSAVTWQGLVSALAAIGMAVVAIGRVQTSASIMRIIVLAGSPFWFAHDLLIKSPVAAADALSLTVGLGALAWQHFKSLPAGRGSWIIKKRRYLLADKGR